MKQMAKGGLQKKKIKSNRSKRERKREREERKKLLRGIAPISAHYPRGLAPVAKLRKAGEIFREAADGPRPLLRMFPRRTQLREAGILINLANTAANGAASLPFARYPMRVGVPISALYPRACWLICGNEAVQL